VSADDPVTYETYLRLERILDAQEPMGPDGAPRERAHHDEMLFIVVHQAYELWFKQVLHELTFARDLLAQDPVSENSIPRICSALRRVHEIQKVLLAQLPVIETMNPVEFLAFRDSLGNASGFQSAQFRELEILAGLKDEKRVHYQGDTFERRFRPETVARFDALRREPSLREALDTWLERTPLEPDFVTTYLDAFDRYVDAQRAVHEDNPQLSDEERASAVEMLENYRGDGHAFLEGDDAHVHAACLFIAAYREEPLLERPNRLLDALLEFEELWRLWRYRHARMVERMIGLRVGTGGSSGVAYLDKTASERYRIFTVILRSRSFLVPRRLLPPLKDPSRYGFAADA